MFKEAKHLIDVQVENYNKPTPKKWKRWGRVVKFSGRIVAGLTLIPVLAAAPWIPFVAFALGEVGNVLINLKKE